jgi:exopolysaccharide production protein ExoQ
MPPLVALLAWFVLLVALFRYDPGRDKKESWALWIPLTWMFFIASRDPSQWLAGGVAEAQAYDLQQGNPIDRLIFSALILLAVIVLSMRSFQWGKFLARNVTLLLFLVYCLSSALWSDFPSVTIKHWVRDLANYLMVLVILTDPRPVDAVRTVLRRLSFLIIPLSVVLIKYFPVLGRQYGEWSGETFYVGVSTSKNMLGAACLVSGIYCFWDMASRWSQRKERRTRLILWIDALFVLMTLWVMHMAQSTTSTVCLGLAGVVIFASRMQLFRWRPGLFKSLAPTGFIVYLVLTYVLGLRGALAASVGKDSTLTDRTKIWAFLLKMHTNPAIGVGYQTFWIGARLEKFWRESGLGHLSEAHNGYLEVYLELGLIGLFLISLFLIASYWSACRKLATDRPLAVLGAAAWMVMVFYNMSEAALEGGQLFMLLLMGTMTVPQRVRRRVTQVATVPQPVTQQQPQRLAAQPAPAQAATVQQGAQWFRR